MTLKRLRKVKGNKIKRVYHSERKDNMEHFLGAS